LFETHSSHCNPAFVLLCQPRDQDWKRDKADLRRNGREQVYGAIEEIYRYGHGRYSCCKATADGLSTGIVSQFPDKFNGADGT